MSLLEPSKVNIDIKKKQKIILKSTEYITILYSYSITDLNSNARQSSKRGTQWNKKWDGLQKVRVSHILDIARELVQCRIIQNFIS